MKGDLPRGILFDLDDTILEQEKPDSTWKRVIGRYSAMISEATPEAILDSILERQEWYWGNPERNRRSRLNPARASNQLVSEAFSRLNIDDPRIVDEIVEVFRTQREESEKPYSGVLETLQNLKEQGIKTALVTNGNRDVQRRKVERHGFHELFDFVLIEGEVGMGKPDPRVYNHALDKLAVMPKNAWMVGNNLDWEVAVPQRLGIYGVWVDRYGDGIPENSSVTPDRIIQSIAELL